MKKYLLLGMTAISLSAHADVDRQQNAIDDFFTPYAHTELRMPAVPLFLIDPNISVWSPANQLTDRPTIHWTGHEHPMDGFVRIDGKTYRFMGAPRDFTAGEPLLKMAYQEAWTARVNHNVQNGTDWTTEGFNDSAWPIETGAFGEGGEYPSVRTRWTGEGADIYIRRTLTLTAEDLEKELWIIYSHDDVFELYINGHRVVNTGLTWVQGERHKLSDAEKSYLHAGNNVIAAHCHNTTGGAYVDYGVFPNASSDATQPAPMKQTDVNVMATSTYYTFEQDGVALDVVFTAPMLLNDLDRLAAPANYVSFRATPTDGKQHDVQVYFGVSPELAVYQNTQAVSWQLVPSNTLNYARVGATPNNPLSRNGDGIQLNWGYLYLAGYNGNVTVDNPFTVLSQFSRTGALDPMPANTKTGTAQGFYDYPTLAYVHDFGNIREPASTYTVIGYDDVYAMQYFDQNYKGYWTKKNATIEQVFEDLHTNYEDIMQRCRELDGVIYADGYNAGGKEYAELLSGSYRQVIAAHKLFEDSHGHLLFFSKENYSGGMVNTLDVTYPSQPLFLLYNVDLAKAMLTSVMEYAESDRWGFDFAPHDIGRYPLANGQVYTIAKPDANGGFQNNMPIEESGNMLCLMATIALIDGNVNYPLPYWNTLQKWADYLSQYGQDPENQLCTDDFAGHLAHNANLSLKAIFGVAGFAEMARLKGDETMATRYLNRAREMAQKWAADDLDRNGDHYKLTLDRDGTWSMKYNAVWDELWQLNLLPEEVMTRELNYYKGRQLRYGIPLDNRDNTTKSDWVMWTAAMAKDKETFRNFMLPIYDYVNETPDRVPIVDRHHADNGRMVSMQARSVIGGYWMRLFMSKFNPDIVGSTGRYYNNLTNSVDVLEAENGTGNGVAVNDDTACSNGQFVGNLGNGSTVSFKYNAEKTGEYDITVFYMTDGARNLYVQVNNGEKSLESYTSTGGWNGASIGQQNVRVTLNAGENTIVIGNEDGWAPNVDKLEVSAVSIPKIVEKSMVIEAENTIKATGVTTSDDNRASGGQYVGFVGNGKTLTFHYEATEAGEYSLESVYCTAQDRNFTLSVNGDVKTLTAANVGSWDAASLGKVRTVVNLKQGDNVFVIDAAGDAPNFDKFTISSMFIIDSDLDFVDPISSEVDRKIGRASRHDLIYNLNGQSVGTNRSLLRKGVYISGGRKFVVK